jgi:hypothetical protein
MTAQDDWLAHTSGAVRFEWSDAVLIAEMPADIEVEREALDRGLSVRGRPPATPLDCLAPDDEPQLDFGALLEAVGAPVVEHRRRRVV